MEIREQLIQQKIGDEDIFTTHSYTIDWAVDLQLSQSTLLGKARYPFDSLA